MTNARRQSWRTALLAAAGLFAATLADAAQPRQPVGFSVVHPPLPDEVETHAWLSRLAGRFRYDGMLDTAPGSGSPDSLFTVSGMSDCILIGGSSGVHCVMNLDWQEKWTVEGAPITVPNLKPAMLLYGLEPASGEMRYLEVDNKGIASGGRGVISGNRATFRSPCVNRKPRQQEDGPGAAEPGDGMASAAPGASGNADGSFGGSDGFGGSSANGEAHVPTGPAGGADFALPGGLRAYSAAEVRNLGSSLGCQKVTYIDARPGARLIHITIAIGDRFDPEERFTLTLRRQDQ